MSTPLLPEPPVIMPFGRYKYWAIQYVPDDYLHWLMHRSVLEQRWSVFERQLRAEMERRRVNEAHERG